MDQSQDIPAAAPSSKQDIMEEHQTTTTNQPRLESSTNSDGKIILRMARSKKSSTPVNGVTIPAPPVESTETPNDFKEVKPKKRRQRKPKVPLEPTRRSTRHTSAIAEEPKTNSMEPSSQATDAGKSKSRATLTKSISPPPASNTSTNGVNKRVFDGLDQVRSVPSITEEDIEYSYRTSSNIPLPASKRRKLLQQQRNTVSPSTPAHDSKENSPSSSEKSGSSSGSDNLYDEPYSKNTFFNHHFAFPVDDYEDSLRDYSVEASNSPSAPASPPSSTGFNRKAFELGDELEDNDAAFVSQNIDEAHALEVRGGGGGGGVIPSKKASPSVSPSPSIRGGNAVASMDGASGREVRKAFVEPSETASITQRPPPKKRGRPAAAYSKTKKAASKAAPKSILKKPAPPGRRKKTSENARVQAAYDRMVDLKKSYREIAKGLKPALAMIADRELDLMAEDPIAHHKVPEYKTVMDILDSTHCSRIAMLNQSHDTQLQFAETQHRQAVEYSNVKFKCAIQDILERSLARAKEAFLTTYDRGVQQDIVEDDNVSVDENRDVHLRDLNAFNVHEDGDASSIDMELPGISTPLKSQYKNRGPNSLLDLPLAAPIAKHSLLAVTQEQEPSSLPPSRVATPEPVDNGKFDEYGVHIPNRIRRGRMVEPNNRAIVKSWIEYDPWDIQYEIMGSKKKARIQSGKKTELTYLDQTSFTNQGGGGYKLSSHRPEDFDQDIIKLYGLHPSYGIPIKGSENHIDLSQRTDFSRPLDNTQPIAVVDVEETRPISPGGTRKPVELPEPHILSRSTSMIYADRYFDQFLNRHRMKDVLGQSGAGRPSVKGFATYDAEVRDEQKAKEGVAELLEADRVVEEVSAKEASAAAAAAAANIAHKSSIHAIVNSDDGDSMSSTSRINRPYQTNIKMKATHQPVLVPGFDLLNEAINVKTMQNAPQLPPGGYFYGPRARDYGLQPREYIPQDGFAERGMPLPPQPYVQQQAPMHQQLPPPPQVMSYNTGAHSQQQQQLQMQPQAISYNNGAPAQPQHQMMQTLHSQTMAPIPSSPYYNQPPQGHAMAPATRGYSQFNHYVPAQQRTSEQAQSQASQAASRSHRELRPMPPQNGIEWVAKHDAAHFYRNSSPLPASQAPPPPPAPTIHYQPPNSFGFWPQHNQQGAGPSQSPPQQHSQVPTQQGQPMHQSSHPQQQQQPLLPNPRPFTSGPADVSNPNGAAVKHYPREDDSHQKNSIRNQSNQSKRGKKK